VCLSSEDYKLKHKTIQSILLATAVLLLTASISLAADTSNKWRLEVSGKAKSDGSIVLELSPEGGVALTAEIVIADKTGENDVAKAIVKALKAELSKEQFHVERDDGEDVLIKKKRGQPKFGLVVISNTVENVRLNLDKE